MSTCSQSAPWSMVVAHSEPSWAKSALRIEGAIMAGGLIVIIGVVVVSRRESGGGIDVENE